ncbi:MAG: thymidylate synthase [Clostridiales bacterium]|jgi:thymidylate synthase|nr:thymidylate synthase [Clostridiales bacterium]
MKEIFIEKRTLPEAYHAALAALWGLGEKVGCSDYNTDCVECAMTVAVQKPTAEPRVSKLIIGGPHELQQYCMEMLDGILDFKIERGWHYTYHARYAKYYDFIVGELKRNPESRRAIVSIRENAEDAGADSPACMQSLQFFIRGGKLDLMVLFRSNDLPEAFFFNAFALIRLQERAAAALGVKVGTYTHRSNSMHAYKKNFDMLAGFVRSVEAKPIGELVYGYKGDFQDMMEEEIPAIMKKVEQLQE